MHSRIVLNCAAAMLALAACDKPKPATPATSRAVSQPPAASLWRIDVVEGGKRLGASEICADETVRASFTRPAPEWRGQPCVRVGEAKTTGAAYFARCRFGQQIYTVSSSATGDPMHDLTVDMSVTAQDGKGASFEQTRRYQRLGACPAGLRIGDTRVVVAEGALASETSHK